MVIGYHVVIGAYGFWLPNDPRGSWSDFVGSWELYRFGPATKTNATRSQANAPHDQELRQRSKEGLKRPPVSFSGVQALAIGRGFGRYVDQSVLPVWACAILPEHIHLVVGRSQLSIEQVVIQLKGAATRELMDWGIHPFGNQLLATGRPPKCFARPVRAPFLDSVENIQRDSIRRGQSGQGR